MTPSEAIQTALSQGILIVDTAAGVARSARWSKALGQCKSARGYRVCTLHVAGERKQLKMHQIIWIAANGAIPDGLVIDHINRDKTDNRLSNLRLAGPKENSANRRSYDGADNPSAKIDATTAATIRGLHGPGVSYRALADRFGVSKSLVAQICRGEIWKP